MRKETKPQRDAMIEMQKGDHCLSNTVHQSDSRKPTRANYQGRYWKGEAPNITFKE